MSRRLVAGEVLWMRRQILNLSREDSEYTTAYGAVMLQSSVITAFRYCRLTGQETPRDYQSAGGGVAGWRAPRSAGRILQDHPVLEFSGPATIRQAAETHARLISAVTGEGAVTLDVSGVTATDVSFVQLVESARRTLAEAGRDLSLKAPADGALRDVLERGGFLAGDDDARRQFWIQNGAPQ